MSNNIQDSKNILNIGGNFVVQGDVIVGDGAQKVQLASGSAQLLPSDYLENLPEIFSAIKFPNEPFIGLHWFERDDARIFFGRGKMIKMLYDLLHSPTADNLILLYGQSGVGKSSLLNAGLLPRLEANWEVVYERRNSEVLVSKMLEKSIARAPEEAKLVVIIDQLEEVLTVPNADSAEELILLHDFIKETQKIRPNIKWIASFRKEFVAEMEVVFQKIPFTKVFVPPLQQEGIQEAILGVTGVEGAKQKYQLTIENGLAEKIASDIFRDQSSHIAPALQILLTKFWEQAKQRKPNAPHFSHEAYQELVRKSGLLLDEFLEEQLKKLPSIYLETGLALDILHFYTTPLSTAAEHTQQELFDRYAHLPEAELRNLVIHYKNLYLLTDNRDDDHQRLAHDALAPLVTQRYNSSGNKGQRARSLLENRIKNSPQEELIALNARDLKTIEVGKDGMRVWTEKEQELVELSRQNIRRQGLIRSLIFGILGTLLVTTIILIYQNRQSVLAELERQEYELLRYEADNAADPTQKYNRYRELLARNQEDQAIQDQVYQLQRENVFYKDLALSNADYKYIEVAISASGEQWAMYYQDGEQHRIDRYSYDPTKGELIYQNSIQEATSARLETLRFSADGARLFGGGNDHVLHRWNALGKDFPSDKLGGDKAYKIEVLDLSPDGKRAIASFFGQRSILLYNIEKQQIESYIELGEATALQFLGNNNQFVAALRNGQFIQYDIATQTDKLLYEGSIVANHIAYETTTSSIAIGKQDGIIILGNLEQGFSFKKAHDDNITALQFSKDGRLLLTASKDKTAKLWRVNRSEDEYTTELLYTLRGHQATVSAIGFSEDEKMIFTVADKIRTWKLPTVLPETMFTATSSLNAIAKNDKFIFAATNRAGILVWDKATATQESNLRNGSNQKMTAVAADESLLVAGDESGKIYVWQSDNQKLLNNFSKVHRAAIRKVLLTEKRIAILAEDKTISIWDRQNRNQLSQLQHTASIIDMVSSADGKMLYSISIDGKIQVWSLNDFKAKVLYESFETDFTHLIYQSDNQRLITTTSSDSLQIWQLDGELEQQIPLPSSAVSLAELFNGKIAVGTSEANILMIDEQGNIYQQLKLGIGNTPIDLLVYKKQLLTATENGKIQIWSVKEELLD
ncbi:MAG: AAA family ATPase [Bacteroidota bacterium]